MPPVHARPLSPDPEANKRVKITHGLPLDVDHTPHFVLGLFDHNSTSSLHETYVSNEPFKFAVIEKLFQDDLLKDVKDECLRELSFAEKETDIYKVNQTGDLASLDYLTGAQISLLPSLVTLRDALYSAQFRKFLQTITGCGPLSGRKQDMSVNSYKKGCHLLNHDDVIGTRRVSYILYMPLPHHTPWQREWGGALELYPIKIGPGGEPEPECAPSKVVAPRWNQFILFEVQPGKSFHSVEEVVVGGEAEDGRERLSISGWFHAAQEGEEGYTPSALLPIIKSSREQLTSTSTIFKEYPAHHTPPPLEGPLSEDDVGFLSEFLNPVYLKPRTMEALSSRFVNESSLELHSFLNNDLADALKPRLRFTDTEDGLDEVRGGRIPPHTAGTDGPWAVKGPPHKWRYCALAERPPDAPVRAVIPRHSGSLDDIMRSLQDELFPSRAFRSWLAIVTRVLPLSYSVEARRFRPGLDYTLAVSDDDDARLDIVLGLTPNIKEADEAPESLTRTWSSRQPEKGWQAAEWGGWECYMAPHDEEDDPAIYRSGGTRKETSNIHAPSNGEANGLRSPRSDEVMDDDDSTLLTVQPGFNRLLLVLRDARVMRFVKYVSAAAEGSRWDICGEYEVGMLEDDEGTSS